MNDLLCGVAVSLLCGAAIGLALARLRCRAGVHDMPYRAKDFDRRRFGWVCRRCGTAVEHWWTL